MTFCRVNERGDIHYIKYHFLGSHGQKQFTYEEAVRICGEDPDYSKRDLWHAIETGDHSLWIAKYQIMTTQEAEKCNFDPFDVTKVWPRGIPLTLLPPFSGEVLAVEGC